MEAILRAFVVYVFMLLVFRVTGKRSLGQITTFDFVLLLIISECTQQALTGKDFSMTHSFLSILTLMALDIGLSLWKNWSPKVEQLLEDTPIVIVENGRPLKDRMDKERVDEADVLEAARKLQGLERMEQIKYAVLERSGEITVIPKHR